LATSRNSAALDGKAPGIVQETQGIGPDLGSMLAWASKGAIRHPWTVVICSTKTECFFEPVIPSRNMAGLLAVPRRH
jgi:hypothetical protein